jgi:hypothetical protein
MVLEIMQMYPVASEWLLLTADETDGIFDACGETLLDFLSRQF